MDTDEKLTELKKAYADMILNTAKEAAGRIMMSERKAHRLEFELKEVKENALQMLTRLKQTMDSKIFEAEMASRTQQKKIEELEAQLQEAEDIVKDLREELSSMHAVTPDSIPTSHVRNQSNKPQILHNSLFPFRKSYIHDQDLPSIILRNKGRKLYRSGCTHRIHACERTPREQTNPINLTLITKKDEESEKLHKHPSSLVDERKKDRKRTSPKTEDSDESSNTVTDLVRVIDELPPVECEKTELPLTLEPPVVKTTSGRVIKYTFQRKRKRGTLTTTNGSDLVNNMMKKKEEDENALLEVKSIDESTHLENVAQQLIALSANGDSEPRV